MKIVFMGTPAYAVPTLDALVEAGHEVLWVVAQPDKPSGRGQALQAPPTVERARALGIPTRQPKALRSGPFPGNLRALGADVGVVVAYGRILTPELLQAPRLGCVNGHGSLLPAWRGAAPMQWSLLSGDAETGVTTMLMDEGLDTGDMLLREAISIGEDETFTQLSARLAALTASLMVRSLAALDGLTPTPQDHSLATHARPLNKDDGRLDWTRPARALKDQVRALELWPGTFCGRGGDVIKVKRARVVEGEGAPGVVIEAQERLVVACGQGALEILEAQAPNKRAVGARDFINGARVRSGEVWT